jgi:hypothetical protein
MRKFVFISVMLTLPAAIYFSINFHSRAELISWKNKKIGISNIESKDVVLKELYLNIKDTQYLEDLIGRKSIEEISKFSEILFTSKVPERQNAAALISYIAGVKYRNPPLLYRAARYYMAAPIRDYGKALDILNIEYVAGEGFSDYYRGLIWQDVANPDQDLKKARVFFEKARDAGIRAAERMLINLDERSKAAGG